MGVLPIQVSNVVDFSLILTLVGIVSYFFGRLMYEVGWQREDKFSNYVHGFLFLCFFVFLPLFIFLFVTQKVTFTKESAIVLSVQFITIFWVRKFWRKDITLNRIEKSSDEELQRRGLIPFISMFPKLRTWPVKVATAIFLLQLFILSAVQSIGFYLILTGTSHVSVKFFSFAMAVVALGMLAALQKKVELKFFDATVSFGNKKLSGRLHKIEDEWVTIIKDTKTKKQVLHINKDKIDSIMINLPKK
ncbi:MAG: hypothetical protein QW165_02650 [Candidatus Woesearchaeota archaeon]